MDRFGRVVRWRLWDGKPRRSLLSGKLGEDAGGAADQSVVGEMVVLALRFLYLLMTKKRGTWSPLLLEGGIYARAGLHMQEYKTLHSGAVGGLVVRAGPGGRSRPGWAAQGWPLLVFRRFSGHSDEEETLGWRRSSWESRETNTPGGREKGF